MAGGAVETTASGSAKPSRNRRFTRYLAQPLVLEELGPPGVLRATLGLLVFLVFGFVAWSAITRVAETTRAVGFVTPFGSVQSIQHLEGGIIAEILVRDGALVEAGKVLVRLDPTAALAELDSKETRLVALMLQANRLRAFAKERQPEYGNIPKKYKELIEDQLVILQLQEQARRGQRRVIHHQIEQRRAELRVLREEGLMLKERIAIATQMLEMREELFAKGLVSRILYLNTKQELNAAQGEFNKTRGKKLRARQAISETRGRLTQLDAELKNDAAIQMGQLTAEIAELRQTIARLRDRVNRHNIKSPVRGVVKGLAVNTIGGVVPSGGVIAEIVPLEEDLIVEARLSPADIGHLDIGQLAAIKVQTFDFARFGSIQGTLENISATTFKDQDGSVYYKGIIKLNQSHVGSDPNSNLILPGMTVDVDVTTGDRTLLRYLLRPVYESLDRAFGER